MHASRLTIAATVVLALEAAALLLIALIEVFGLGEGDAASLASAAALVALTAVGAIGLGLLAFAVLRGRSFGRSGGMVVQILAIAIGLSALGVRPFPTLFVLALVVPGVLGAVLLFLLARREGAAARRHADENEGAGE